MAGPLLERPRVWTIDDLGDLPEGARYEIVDGHLLVSPPPTSMHDVVLDELRFALSDAVGDRWRVAGPVGIAFGVDYREPDLVVLVADVQRYRRELLRADEVLLSVEIVSPSSRTTDRILKPAQYAAAGIMGYWRVETDPELTLTAYVIDPQSRVYREVGTWLRGQQVDIGEPVTASFELGAFAS